MKACVFSDIHGNGPAFDEALKLIRAEAADVNIFLGDLCGYYFNEIEVFEQLMQIPDLIALRGNHDQMFIDAAEGNSLIRNDYKMKYSCALEEFLKKDTKRILAWLKSLDAQFLDPKGLFSCYHGSPRDPLHEYIYPDSDFGQFAGREEIIFLGHTHRAFIHKTGSGLVVNPGSVGQPRDGKMPSILVIDLKTRSAQHKYFSYNYEKVLQQIDEIGDKTDYLKKVIFRSFSQ